MVCLWCQCGALCLVFGRRLALVGHHEDIKLQRINTYAHLHPSAAGIAQFAGHSPGGRYKSQKPAESG